MTYTISLDYNAIRTAFARLIESVTGRTAILEEPEEQDAQRPDLPYFSFKFLGPAAKSGDDSKDHVSGTTWNSGGVRKMTVEFNCYGNTSAETGEYGHEESYNLMVLWQSALDLEDVQAVLRAAGMAVCTIGNVADLSQLLQTGYEGRAHLEATFNVAVNIQSDLGEMSSVEVVGTVTTDQGNVVSTDQTVP